MGYDCPVEDLRIAYRVSRTVILLAGLAALLVGSSRLLKSGPSEGASQDDPYRPSYHFSPAKNWMNDPNGLVRVGDTYHMYFQFNPFGIVPAHMSWGHAVSKDLMHWQELPVAIPEQGNAAVFSGSAVLDTNNTSGFGQAGKPPLVAIYTLARPGKQNQNVAFSNDNGSTFTPFAGNPVIDLGMAEFRDPMVFWHEQTRQWVMVVSMADLHKVRFYHSPDLKSWKLGGEFGPAGISGVPNWECPNLFELHSGGTSKWILMLGIGAGGRAGGPAGGSATEYFVGSFDGNTFHNDNPPTKTLWLDNGSDFYAAQTWSGMTASDNRRIVIAWMSNWDYGTKIPTQQWRGQMSLPRELTLTQGSDGWRLRQNPVREVKGLRGRHQSFPIGNLQAVNEALAKQQFGKSYEIMLRFAPGTQSDSGVEVRKDGSAGTKIGFQQAGNIFYVDRSRSGKVDFASSFSGKHSAPLSPIEGQVSLHIFVDRCSVEVFGNDGQQAITDLIFPDASAQSIQVFSSAGFGPGASMELWELDSSR